MPRALGPLAAVRYLLASPLSDLIVGRGARRLVPQAEREALALGRAFGANSVETAKQAGDEDAART